MNHKFCHISPLDIHEYQMETQKDQIDKKILENIFDPHKSSFQFQEKLALKAKKSVSF